MKKNLSQWTPDPEKSIAYLINKFYYMIYMKIRYYIVILIIFVISPINIFAEDSTNKMFNMDFGIFPTTMGTHSEYLYFDYSPLDFFFISVSGSHNKIYQGDIDFEKTGADIHGNIEEDILYGEGFTGIKLSIGIFSFLLKAGGIISSTKSISNGRIIETGIEYIDDTFGLIDIDSSELYYGPAAGLNISFKILLINVKLTGLYLPVIFGKLHSSYFQNFPQFDINGNLIYYWRKNTEDLPVNGFSFEAGGAVEFRIEKIMSVSLSGNVTFINYSSGSIVENEMLTYFQPTPADDPIAIPFSNNFNGITEITDIKIETGIFCSLDFIEEKIKISSKPVLGISYIKVLRDELHNFFDYGKEKWIDDYQYVKFTLLWRM